MLEIKVLFWVRQDFYTHPGGDSTQALSMLNALRGMSIDVEISQDINISLKKFTHVFIWHLTRIQDSWYYCRKAKDAGKKVILVDTYWPMPAELPLFSRRRLAFFYLKTCLRLLINIHVATTRNMILALLKHGCRAAQQELLCRVDAHIVNSEAEKNLLTFYISDIPIFVMHNIPPMDRQNTHSERWNDVICVGHFCPRKNQKFLISALKTTGLGAMFCGGCRPMHILYYLACLWHGRDRHSFMGHLPNEQVWHFLCASRVNICSSVAETPGIANLEAMQAGCVSVLPDLPPVREYFGNNAQYFTPGDPFSLRGALTRALSMPTFECISYSQKSMLDELRYIAEKMGIAPKGNSSFKVEESFD